MAGETKQNKSRKMFSFIFVFSFFANICSSFSSEHHHNHGSDQERKPIYFVPTLKDAANLADLLFAQAHFT